MTPLALLITLAPSPQTVDAPTLEYYQEHFVVRKGTEAWRVPAHPPAPRPALSVSFRRNDTYAVWDERGLTIRRGNRTRTTTLPDIPTSPRAFSRPEILRTIDLMRQGKRTRNAAALSGALRIGGDAYFLVRWEETGGKPWSEVLVRVDLAGDDLQPALVGRFEGMSVAFRPIDDRLFRVGNLPAVVTRSATAWGVATFAPEKQQFGFRKLGNQLFSLMPLSRTRALFVEGTAYGTTTGGEVDLESGVRQERFEVRGSGRFVDTEEPWISVTSRAPSAQVRNGESGAETTIPLGAGVRRAGPYIVVFTPYDSPTRATLYQPDRWTKVGEWRLSPREK